MAIADVDVPGIGDERLPAAFWQKVSLTDAGCWLWTGSKNASGYGVYSHRLAHRVSFSAFDVASIARQQVDHLCHDPKTCAEGDACPHRACVNPAHLEAVQPKVNVARSGGLAALNTAKTHCPQGHPYDAANTRPLAAEGKRRCHICRTEQFRRAHARRRARQGASV